MNKLTDAEIESLKIELQAMRMAANTYKAEAERYKGVIKLLEKDVSTAKSEAIKEFADRMKARIHKDIDEQVMFPLPYTKKAYDTVMVFIDNLVKEMTERL